jgi:dolichol-phosphate mannosyltransferase
MIRSDMHLGIACPMANESAAAVRFVTAVLDQCRGFRSVDFFAVVDTVSADDTLARLKALGAEEPRLRVVWAPENRCVVDAYVRGYREALACGCDWILEIDAGFSHQPEEIPQYFEQMEQGFDCVFGSRFIRGGSIRDSGLRRKLISWGGTVLTNFLLGTTLTDMTSGFELFRRDALVEALNRGIRSRGPFFQTEIKFHCSRMNVAEVPITYRSASASVGQRELGESLRILWELYRESKAERVVCNSLPWL